ncbi:MAG: penicillin-binding protein 1C [Sideroxydans sp.]|nr:penicillin-binding protein 1C [Sideroxydans sp.]
MLPKRIRLFLLLAAITSAWLGISAFFSSAPSIPSFAATKFAYRPSEAWLLDRNGEVIAVKRIDNTVRRLPWVSLQEISPAAQELLLVSEDKRFYSHGGVDWLALLASASSGVLHLFDGKRPRGASTLTMQLAGFLDPALAPAKSKRTLAQKWRQIIAAREIEKTWGKREILEAYFNLAAFRGEIVGINAASFALFGSHPQALNRAQSLLLVALLKGPMTKPEQVASRACALLKASQENDPSCAALRDLARVALNSPGFHIPQDSIAPHLAQKLLRQAGSRITSTLDANLQRFAIQSLHQHLLALDTQNVKDGAVVVIDNSTGDVLAYIGSSGDISAAANVDGAVALRQAGSTLKPFLYGMAIEDRILTAASVMDDSPLQLNTAMGLYIPQNYDRDFKGAVSVRTALASSLNVPAVRTLGLIGVDRFARTLRAYGLQSVTQDGDHYGFSLALGGVDVSLLELSNAYRALANQGMWHPLGFQTADHAQTGKRVLSRQAAFIIANILADKGARAMTFGLENPLATKVWTAAKTGTSKDMRDNWCIGFSSRYTVGVWVGNFDGAPMRDVSGVSGAAPVWRDLMDYLHANNGSAPPKPPRELVAQAVRFSPAIESARSEWFVGGTETGEIKLANTNSGAEHAQAKILYPTDGTVIAMDPDIPPNHQRVQFNSRGSEEVAWILDGTAVGNGADVGWNPSGGRHKLVLTDVGGNELDTVRFEVRGAMSP